MEVRIHKAIMIALVAAVGQGVSANEPAPARAPVSGHIGPNVETLRRGIELNQPVRIWGDPAGAGDKNQSFVNFETPHVHPLDLTPDGTRLLAVNTPDNRLEVFDIANGQMSHLGSVFVGLDPVSVRARTDTEVWVVSHVSDAVSIVNLDTMNVIITLRTADEPADVVFAGSPERAFVSCSQANEVLVFDPKDLSVPPTTIPIDAEDPRAMAVSPDGSKVYVAIFESGNGSTVILGTIGENLPTNNPNGPYGGQNPPPNDGEQFRPPMNPDNPPPPPVSLIVRKNASEQWMDDNGADWTEYVTGNESHNALRQPGWDLPDRDVAVVDAESLEVEYAARLMNLCMAIGVSPATGMVYVVGTDATNEVRFGPVLAGRFLRVNLAVFDPSELDPAVVDLNPHLVYTDDIPFTPIPQAQRDKSIGDPRAIAFNPDGTRAYVAGMGSNNVVIIDGAGGRLSPIGDPDSATIEVGAGPTGLAVTAHRLFVLNKFDSSISVLDLATEQIVDTVTLFDPSPPAVLNGRKFLYDTHETSGLGHIACASCHADARMDRLAWDVGNPAGEMKTFNQNCAMGTAR